ncbi:hypothetical protein BKA70DRAFT_1491992 [Coprinopsis sp. MPI-PUGE-AT-0042]|nr:hypothetical protein BKA70DRAFT_1491992 [Coprinopsis sp. MPI-PUGE-AT-0042]
MPDFEHSVRKFAGSWSKESRASKIFFEGKEGKNGREWSEEEVAKIGSDVVIELQRIVIGRYRSMLSRVPVGEVREDVMGSRLLKGEYDERKSRAERYLTAGELREIEEKKRKKIGEENKRKKEEEEHKERKRVTEAARLEATKKNQDAAQALVYAEKKANEQGTNSASSNTNNPAVDECAAALPSQSSQSNNSQPSSYNGPFRCSITPSQKSASPFGTFSSTPNTVPTPSGFAAVPSTSTPTPETKPNTFATPVFGGTSFGKRSPESSTGVFGSATAAPQPKERSATTPDLTKPSPSAKPLFVVSSGTRNTEPSMGFSFNPAPVAQAQAKGSLFAFSTQMKATSSSPGGFSFGSSRP